MSDTKPRVTVLGAAKVLIASIYSKFSPLYAESPPDQPYPPGPAYDLDE